MTGCVQGSEVSDKLEGKIYTENFPIMEIHKKVQLPVEELVLGFTTELSFSQDESMESNEDKMFQEGCPLMKDKKNKKKKKCKGGLQSPKRILAFNASEWLKLDENKAEIKKSPVVKKLSKCATFPGPASPFSLGDTNAGTLHAEGSGESEGSDQQSLCGSPDEENSVLMRWNSLPPKSALRGGSEVVGLGPRPKFHVKWAPDVWEPPCSSISHTVNQYHSKKKDCKHGQKGKSSHGDKKHERKLSHKSRHNGESGILGRHVASHNVRHNRYLQEVAEAEYRMPPDSESNQPTPIFKTVLSKQESAFHKCDAVVGREEVHKSESGNCFDVTDGQTAGMQSGGMEDFHFPNDSKCARSFLGIGGLQYELICGEAM